MDTEGRSIVGARALVAYGLLGEVVAAVAPPFGMDYMGEQARALRAMGASSVAVVPCPTAARVSVNAARLRAALLSDPRPAVVVAHSKGGLEALEALLDPAARARCLGLVAQGSPFFGSPVADAVAASRAAGLAARGAARLLRIGDGEGLSDLTTAGRAAWWRARGDAARAALGEVPVACVAAVMDDSARGSDRRYLPLARWLEARGAGPNDGLVPLSSALLPGARHLVLRGVSHRGAVAGGRGRDPVGPLRAALAALSLLPDGGTVAGVA